MIPEKPDNIRPFRSVAVAIVLVAAALAAGSALAQNSTVSGKDSAPPRIVDDKRLGEEEEILQRMEWFYSSRRAGTVSDSQMSELRHKAFEETRRQIEAQNQRNAAAALGQPTWLSMGPSPSTFGGWTFGNVSGRVSSITADWENGVLWLGSASGGVWKSTNDGLSWTSVFDSAGTMTIGTVVVDPNDSDVIWVGTGENNRSCESYFGIGLLRSPDGGQTWEQRNGTGINSLNELATVANVVIDPDDSNHIVTGGKIRGCASGAEAAGGIFTTTDGGQSWTQRLFDTEIYEIQQDPTDLEVYWAGTSRGVYKSVDDGVTWTLQTASGLPSGSTGRTEIAIAPSNGNVVYALFAGGGRSLWRTTDGGATWTQRASSTNACDGQCWYNMVLRVHPTNWEIVYRGTIRLFMSWNGGSTWADLSNSWGSSQTVHQDMHDILVDPTNGQVFYAAGDGGLWKTVNEGSTFTNLNGNLNITQFYAIGTDASNPNVICGGAQDNSSLVRTSGNIWDRQRVTGDGFVCHINPVDNDYAYITSYPSGGPRIYRSTNGVLGSFQVVTGSGSGISQSERTNWVTPYLLDPSSPNVLYVGTQRIYRSANHGSSWTAQDPADMTAGQGSLKALAINRNFTSYLLAGSESGRVWRTENQGFDWTDITSGLPSGRSINDLVSDPGDPDRAFAVLGGFNTAHLWEWNAGGGWTARGGGLPNVPANTVEMLTSGDMLVGTDTGVFRSLDGGVTFTPYMNGLPQGTVVTDLKLNLAQNIVTAGTYGRGAWQITIDPVASEVRFDSVELPLVEIDGDGDAQTEPGEEWSMTPVLRNIGGQVATDVTARITTDAPGITILDPDLALGDMAPGAEASPPPVRFLIDPAFPCGEDVTFDLVDVQSADKPAGHADQPGFLTISVVDSWFNPGGGFGTSHVGETFEGEAGARWSTQSIAPAGRAELTATGSPGQWERASTPEQGAGYRVTAGAPGVRAWLHLNGTDSGGGAGITIPGDAVAAQLRLVHRLESGSEKAGARVVIDAVDDGRDDFTPLKKGVFRETAEGRHTSLVDLTAYKGRQVWLAFVYETETPGATETRTSDSADADRDLAGWYLDEVHVESLGQGNPICQIRNWPGSVADAQFQLIDGSIQVTWDDSCNLASLPNTRYTVQGGSLDQMTQGLGYTHFPLDNECNLTSPYTFPVAPGNWYFLVAPTESNRVGGLGHDSSGNPRPLPTVVCGDQREATCE